MANQGGEAGETWEKRSRDGRTHGSTFDIIERETRRRVAAMVSGADADALVADHEAARWAAQAKEALETIVNVAYSGRQPLWDLLSAYPVKPQAEEGSKP